METERIQRRVGTFQGSRPGPLLMIVGGLHGNEPAGVAASRRILKRLRALAPGFRGRLVAVAGNLQALERGCRYVEEDLNRIWFPDLIDGVREIPEGRLTAEAVERRELYRVIETELSAASEDVYFLDLHTTSASGAPFTVVADTLHNRRVAEALPAPIVLGLEEHLDGTLLNFINELGYVSIGFEGGQHEAPSSVDAHELAIWRMLVTTDCLASEDCPPLEDLARSVGEQTEGSPSVVEIRYRHAVAPEDGFAMVGGFANLQAVGRGDLLARDRRGEIRALESGRVLMPLYQSQGEDGFFLVRRVRPIWLSVASLVRRCRLDRFLGLLPGVRAHPQKDGFIVNPLVARWFVIELFHLFGFRRRRSEQGRLVLTRRRETPRRR